MNADTPPEPPHLLGTNPPPDVPVVEPAYLAAIWKFMREFQAQHGNQCGMIDARWFQRLCRPGANVEALWYRASMLCMLDKVKPGWMDNCDPETVAKIAATFPMKTMKVGVTYNDLPFDLQEFLKQITPS